MKHDWYEDWNRTVTASTGPARATLESFSGTSCALLSRVLLIEDDTDLSDVLAFSLRGAGYVVETASDGKNGLERILDDTPDVVILDLGIPRMHGYKLLHAVRTAPTPCAVPVMVVTGSADPDVEEKLHRWGVKTVLRKPTSQKSLLRAVRAELEANHW